MKRCGFTLSELLIALAILGLIAVFAISKVLQNQQDSQTKAKLKETIGMLSEVVYNGKNNGDLSGDLSGLNVAGYFSKKINYIKYCPNNASTQGCWDTAVQGNPNGQATGPGFILHNGVTICGMDLNTSTPTQMFSGFDIDLNGTQPPNQSGVDQFDLNMCFGPTACSALGSIGPKTPFTITGWAGEGYDKLLQ